MLTLVSQSFEYNFIKAFHLRSGTPGELTQKLASSLERYNGKDNLVLIIKDQKKSHAFFNLERQPSVRTLLFDQLCPQAPSPAATPASSEISPSTSPDTQQDEFRPAETEAIIKIQRLWRSCSRKIKIRRSYMQLAEAHAIEHYISLSAEFPATLPFGARVAFRDALISKGVAMSLRLTVARDMLSKLQEDAMTCALKVEISVGLFESVDDVIHRNGHVEALLGKADPIMSDEFIAGVVKMGDLTVLKSAMKDVEDVVVEAERAILETRKIVDAMSSKCT